MNKPENSHKRWTDAELAELAADIVKKVHPIATAQRLKRTRSSIDSIRSSLRAPKYMSKASTRLQHFINQLMQPSTKAPARPKTAGSDPLNHRQRWSGTDDVTLTKMFAMGSKPAEMAAKMSRTEGSIVSRLKDLGFLSYVDGTFYTKPIPYFTVK